MPYSYALESLRQLALLHSGWVIGSLRLATSLAWPTSPRPSPRLRTKPLTDTIRHSTLNANAPMQPLQRAANADKWLRG